ncbi:dual specificity protein phosphatase 4-like [Panulirus ornatus]|uniref:dual specificity protein phosphatase 4-like n=1 Tax=Panulirus ornatus TaxID=150431 RepID=UPI003A85CB77
MRQTGGGDDDEANGQHRTLLHTSERGHSSWRDEGDVTNDGITTLDDAGSDDTAPAGDVGQSGQHWKGCSPKSRDKTTVNTQGRHYPLRLAGSQEGQPLPRGPPTPISKPLRQRGPVYSDANVSYVMSDLYVGNLRAAYCDPVLCRLNIQCVVDLSNLLPSQVPPTHRSMCPCPCDLTTVHHRSRLCINIPDSEDTDLTQFMTEVNRFLEGARRSARGVLVHSYHGRSRAPAVIIQYLMTVHSMRLKKAFSLVQTAHGPLAINKGFLKTLQQLEDHLWPGETPLTRRPGGRRSPQSPKDKDHLERRTGRANKTKTAWN